MIKLSLNSSEAPIAPFANTLAAAVEAAGAVPTQVKSAVAAPAKKAGKPVHTPVPSNGLLTRGVQWLQTKGRNKKRMQMIETVSLGDKRFVALVKVDGREFLLGGAPTSVGMLADLGAHGLGELLSVSDLVDTKVAEPTVSAKPVAAEAAAVIPVQAASIAQVPEPIFEKPVEPLTLELPAPVAQVAKAAAPAPAQKLNVTVEADEDESDWLASDDLDQVFKPAVAKQPVHVEEVVIKQEPVFAAAPSAAPVAANVVEIKQLASIEVKEVLKPVAVAAPVVAPAPIAAPVAPMNMNFTFQMWGMPQTAAAPAPQPIAVEAEEVVEPLKAKSRIDLENCPELLGEPYVLALVNNVRGAAA